MLLKLIALLVGSTAAMRVPTPGMSARSQTGVISGMGGATFAAVSFALLGVVQQPFENPNLLSSGLPIDHVYAGVISVVDQLNVFGSVVLPLVVAHQVFNNMERSASTIGEEALFEGELPPVAAGLRMALDSRGQTLAALASDGELLDYFLKEWSQLAQICDSEGCSLGAADEGLQCLEVERDSGLQWVCI